jgi:uncharacterized membrane protein AbrB (regulator of aidB expression)
VHVNTFPSNYTCAPDLSTNFIILILLSFKKFKDWIVYFFIIIIIIIIIIISIALIKTINNYDYDQANLFCMVGHSSNFNMLSTNEIKI